MGKLPSKQEIHEALNALSKLMAILSEIGLVLPGEDEKSESEKEAKPAKGRVAKGNGDAVKPNEAPSTPYYEHPETGEKYYLGTRGRKPQWVQRLMKTESAKTDAADTPF